MLVGVLRVRVRTMLLLMWWGEWFQRRTGTHATIEHRMSSSSSEGFSVSEIGG